MDIRKEKILTRIELEEQRKRYEYESKIKDDFIASCEVINGKIIKKPRTKDKKVGSIRIFKKTLDMCNQADRDIYSLERIYSKYLNGEPLPPLALKDGKYVQESLDDLDLVDLHIMQDFYRKKYGTDLQEVLYNLENPRENNDDLNDDKKADLNKELDKTKEQDKTKD